jgi:hypothetical protein
MKKSSFISCQALERKRVKDSARPVRYYAMVEQEDGTQVCKEVGMDFLEANLDPVYLSAFKKHDKEKGWICLRNGGELAVFKQSSEVKRFIKDLQSVYQYKVREKGELINMVKLNMQFRKDPNDQSEYEIEYYEYFMKVVGSRIYEPISDESIKYMCTNYTIDSFLQQAAATSFLELRRGRILDRNRLVDRHDKDFREEDIGNVSKWQPHYLNVRTNEYRVPVETQQISRIKYNPVTNHWLGVEQEPNREYENPKIVKLSSEWITKQFTPDQIKMFKKVAVEGDKKFLAVPVGDIITVVPTMDISMNPVVRFQQNERSICAFASFASALHYFDFIPEAEFIMKLSLMDLTKENCFSRTLQHIVDNVASSKLFRRFRRIFLNKQIDNYNDLLTDVMIGEEIKLIVLKQADNHESHAVAVVNNMIFDCNASHAIPLTREGIDCCCGENGSFVNVKFGYHFKKRKK